MGNQVHILDFSMDPVYTVELDVRVGQCPQAGSQHFFDLRAQNKEPYQRGVG